MSTFFLNCNFLSVALELHKQQQKCVIIFFAKIYLADNWCQSKRKTFQGDSCHNNFPFFSKNVSKCVMESMKSEFLCTGIIIIIMITQSEAKLLLLLLYLWWFLRPYIICYVPHFLCVRSVITGTNTICDENSTTQRLL